MNITLQAHRVELRPNQFLRIDDAAGTRVLCLRGELWITQDGDLEDHFIHAGDALVLDRSGPTIVSASSPSRVLIEEARPGAGGLARLAADATDRVANALRAFRQRTAVTLYGH